MQPPPDILRLAAGDAGLTRGRIAKIGSIDLPTGRLVLDGYLDRLSPLDADFGARELNVFCFVIIDDDGDSLVAAVLLSIHDDLRPTRWEAAKRVDSDEPTTVYTDFAYITAHDQAMEEDLDEHRQAAIDEHDYLDVLMKVEPPGEIRVLRRTPSDGPGHPRRFAVIPSGIGDGVFDVFLGRDASGRAEQVLVDFLFSI